MGDMARRAASPAGGGSSDFAQDLVKGGDAKSGLGKVLGWNKKTKFVDRVQDTVDLVGIVDPTGVADAANAVGYAARGEWGKAAISAMGIIPYLGDVGKVGKYAARGGKAARVEKAAAKVAERSAARAAEKAAVHGAEKAAVRGAEKAATKPVSRLDKIKQAYQKGRETYEKAKPYIDRGREALDKIKARRQEREGPPQQPQPAPQQAQPSTPTREAPPQGGTLDKIKQKRASGGGGQQGSGGATEVPVDADCPGKMTKKTTWKASPGMKRCAKQTPGRDH